MGELATKKTYVPTRILNEKEYGQIETMSGIRLKPEQIAHILDIKPATFYRMIKHDAVLRDRIERGRARASAKVHDTAYAMAISGNHPSMLMFWLKTQEGFRETDRPVEEAAIKGDGIAKRIRGMTKEQRQARLAEIRALKAQKKHGT